MTWRVLLAGSATGGHIYPGLALASALASSCEAEPHFLTTGTPLEEKLLGTTQFPQHAIPAGRTRLFGGTTR